MKHFQYAHPHESKWLQWSIFLLLCVTFDAQAETVLTLQQAVEFALKNSPVMQVNAGRLAEAQADQEVAAPVFSRKSLPMLITTVSIVIASGLLVSHRQPILCFHEKVLKA